MSNIYTNIHMPPHLLQLYLSFVSKISTNNNMPPSPSSTIFDMSGLHRLIAGSLIFKAAPLFVFSTLGVLCVLSGIPKFEMFILTERGEGGFGQASSGSEL